MDTLQTVVTALLQGVTEFLPISSSAHLILLPRLLGWSDQGLAFDVAVHVGTLLAVVVYFRGELRRILAPWFRSLPGGAGSLTGEARVVWWVIIGTIPAGVAGLLFQDVIETSLRSPLAIVPPTVGFALLLWWADARARGHRDEFALTWRDALVIGLAQALALIPGTSRSGITMTAGLALGLDRASAARFSFLLSIPVIALAGSWKALQLWQRPEPAAWATLAAAAAIAAVFAYVCIDLFLRLIARIGFLPFVIYRIVLGLVLLVLFV